MRIYLPESSDTPVVPALVQTRLACTLVQNASSPGPPRDHIEQCFRTEPRHLCAKTNREVSKTSSQGLLWQGGVENRWDDGFDGATQLRVYLAKGKKWKSRGQDISNTWP